MTPNRRIKISTILWAAYLLIPPALAQNVAIPPRTGQWLIISSVGHGGRALIHTDAIEAAIVAGTWTSPQVGDVVRLPDGKEKTWETAVPDENGEIQNRALLGGYACWIFESDANRILLLDAAGHSLVYVNGAIRAGDVYSSGWVLLPVQVKAGMNVFLFRVSRGSLRATLLEPSAEICFSTSAVKSESDDASKNETPNRRPRDLTAPDLIRGETENVWAALPVLNSTTGFQRELTIVAAYPGGNPLRTNVPPIPPMALRKVSFLLPPAPADASETQQILLKLVAMRDSREQTIDTIDFELPVRNPTDKHKRTFVSEIDGSVQYYGVTPAHPEDDEPLDALFLSLHGAGVEASGQAAAYQHKTWGNLVAATNRRPFGFDWEDWGRLDALEVLALAEKTYKPDPSRIYLTGHSMGGHGVWQVGVCASDRFAAIGPAASWPDFWAYAGAADYENATPIEQILLRAVSPSRTMDLIRNTLMYGVYVLHGDADETVPVELARKMRARLGEFHPDFAYYEYPGGGHWWGNSCVDWPPLFDFFKNHHRPDPASVRHIEFHTNNPGVTATGRWVTIEAQDRQHTTSSVTIDLDTKKRLFTGVTTNVSRLSIDLGMLGEMTPDASNRGDQEASTLVPESPLNIRLDDQLLENIPWPEDEARVWLRRESNQWTVISRPDPYGKNPRRYGPFKHAFDHRFMLVYGTQGTEEMNRLLYERARLDAEMFWYRGNGSMDVLPDTDLDPSHDRDRSVILYGNAETNHAWAALLGDSPVQVKNDSAQIGRNVLSGDDLACLFVRPRPGSDVALVGVVSGTGAAGLRLTERLPYFLSGVALPDCIVIGPEALVDGSAGIRAAGFFGLDWRVDTGDFAWRDTPKAE